MMRVLASAAVVVALSQPALSLSCLAPDVARDYAAAEASDDRYIIVRGQLFFDEKKLPARDDRLSKPQDVTLTAWLKGQSLTSDGFVRPFERDVTMNVICLAHWCGAVAKGDHLVFVKQEGQSFVMDVSPCGSFVYPNPNSDVLHRVEACNRGETCESKTNHE